MNLLSRSKMPSDYKLSPSDSEEFLWTEKGTLYSKEYDDVYFADGKGTDETEYVFLEGSGFAEKLNELNTDDIPPMAYATSLKNVFREDKQESSFSRQEILELSPSSTNGFFKVPKILE